MKQTAVDWLQEELKGVYESDYFNRLLEQAKQMEKEQIIDFAYEIADELACDVLSKKAIEDRYNEFFKSE
jgi:hypothetical protein